MCHVPSKRSLDRSPAHARLGVSAYSVLFHCVNRRRAKFLGCCVGSPPADLLVSHPKGTDPQKAYRCATLYCMICSIASRISWNSASLFAWSTSLGSASPPAQPCLAPNSISASVPGKTPHRASMPLGKDSHLQPMHEGRARRQANTHHPFPAGCALELAKRDPALRSHRCRGCRSSLRRAAQVRRRGSPVKPGSACGLQTAQSHPKRI